MLIKYFYHYYYYWALLCQVLFSCFLASTQIWSLKRPGGRYNAPAHFTVDDSKALRVTAFPELLSVLTFSFYIAASGWWLHGHLSSSHVKRNVCPCYLESIVNFTCRVDNHWERKYQLKRDRCWISGLRFSSCCHHTGEECGRMLWPWVENYSIRTVNGE